ncbi:ATPase domain-containing protein [Mastigocoleus testarum]|uniref:non-specific serine/threonine protein kinase n=1 Tax=Mastigocoleus testarum BC008 TaxID=371196 RepID=A0A0V7ZQF1_9CYAN|nr:ATPase domain-containing protein [Mastigocoleus testarum]KST66583.1 recombinase RecA [Mastigocoleus testarum BC008]
MNEERLSTGITGFDEILCGGLIPKQAYLVRGGPGCGKTILGLHFLLTGSVNNEESLFITLGESAGQIKHNASRIGFDTQTISFLDLSPESKFFQENQTYDIFSPAEVERESTTQRIIECVEKLQPKRVFLDAVTQFRYLSTDEFLFRKQVLSFIRFLLDRGATLIFASESSPNAPDEDLQFISDGVIHLSNAPQGRTIGVTKFRGSGFIPGFHSLTISTQGMQIFPKLRPEVHEKKFTMETISSGIPDLDELLHGGIERGTVTILTGPTGVGKTTVGIQFMKEAAGRGERSVVYTFEEKEDTLLTRCEQVNIPVHHMVENGNLLVVPVEPLHLTPDEFANKVRNEVETQATRIVMIDSVAGYKIAMRGADLVAHLHSLCKYLQNMGVTVILVNEMEHITGNFRATDIGISYIADNIIFLRYLEIQGTMRKAIGVLKKRVSDFEKTLREIEITRFGIKVGKPLTGLRKILSGTPEWDDSYQGKNER